MDGSDNAFTLTKQTEAEGNFIQKEDSPEEIISCKNPLEDNVILDTNYNSEKLDNEETQCGVAPVKQKETIEILNVELVVPQGEKHSIADSNTEHEIIPENIDEERKELLQTNEQNIVDQCTDDTFADTSKPVAATETSSLSLLAQYDSDADSVIEVPNISAQNYRNQVVEIDSDSDSDDSTDSVEYLNELRKSIDKRIEIVAEDVDDDDDEENTSKKRHQAKCRVKGELLLEDLPPIQELHITVPEEDCIEFGKIHSIIDKLVLVSAFPNAMLLNLETVMFLAKGQKILGEVFDVLGQVADPLYCVRFNSNNEIKQREINVGNVVYVAPKTQYTQYVILSNLMQLKGSDASWENDVEPPPRFLEYSDDEQEQFARRQLRNKDRPIDNEDPSKKLRTVDDEEASTSNRPINLNTRRRNQCNDQRNVRPGPPMSQPNVNAKPLYNRPPRSSWHSNYYPQPFPSHYAYNYGMRQPYPSHMLPYTMPPTHNMPYPTTHYGEPPMFQHGHQLMPNAFSMRPPTLHGSQILHQQQQNTSHPPPPGMQ